MSLDVELIERAVYWAASDLLADLNRSDEELRGDADLERDLGLAPIERVELLIRIERTTGVTLGDTGALMELLTLNDLIGWVCTRAGVKPCSPLRTS